MTEEQRESESKETGRLEAFSDGVFAIAITLLVLEIKIPQDLPENQHLGDALLKEWPTYLAFVTSFFTILVMWINHHRLFTHIKRSDNTLLFLNGLLLLGVTFVPFPTALVADYLEKSDEVVALMVYSGTYIFLAVFFNLLWRYAAYKNRLLARNANQSEVQGITKAYNFGPALYLICFIAAPISPVFSLVIALGLAIFFALPVRDRKAVPPEQ
ncbi:MAG TPA: TMEM175 family protein [Chloroflexia bacterium]|nr:TMEM175 family protein [Chloroflexia bacterium]